MTYKVEDVKKLINEENLEGLNEAIEAGFDVNQLELTYFDGRHDYLITNNTEFLNYILDNGYDLKENNKNIVNEILIMDTYFDCTELKEELIELFAKHGANLNLIDMEVTPLIFGICSEFGLYVDELLDGGADVNKCDKYGHSPLFHALTTLGYDTMEKLFDHGAQLQEHEQSEWMDLMIAVAKNDIQKVKELLAKNIDVNHRYETYDDGFTYVPVTGMTGIIYAAYHERVEIVKLLVEHGADVNQIYVNFNGEKFNPLGIAKEYDSQDLINYLIAQGADEKNAVHMF